MLLSLFLTTVSFAQDSPDSEMLIHQNKTTEKIDSFLLNLQKRFHEAKELPPEEISFFEKPENINIFTLFYLDQKDAGLFTGNNGLGKWHHLPFGEFRLVSCSGAIPSNTPLFLALQARINSDWILKKPQFPISISPNIQNEQILYPIQNVFQNKTDSYTESVFFPFIYRLNDTKKPFYLTKNITLTGCRQSECQTVDLPLSLSIPVGKPYPTDICPAMMNEFQSVPIPPGHKMVAKAITQGEKIIQLVLNFNEGIDYINLQIDNNFDWNLEKKYINGKNVHMLLSTKQPIPPQTLLNLKILSSAGWYDVPTILQSNHFIQDQPLFSWGKAFLSGLMLFFFSPLFILFWSLHPQNQKNLISQSRSIGIGIITLASGCAFGFYFNLLPLDLFEIRLPTLIIGIISLIYLLINPRVSLIGAFLFFILLPKPYLISVLNTLDTNTLQPFKLFSFWAVICFIPFFLVRHQPLFFWQLKRVPKQLKTMKRIPIALLFLWSLAVLFGSFFIPTQTNFSFEKLSKALENNKIVYVSVENGYCLSCLMNQAALSLFYPGSSLYKQKELEIFTVKTNSATGQEILGKLMLNPASFGLLYGTKKTYGHLITEYISPEKWGNELWAVSPLPRNEYYHHQ